MYTNRTLAIIHTSFVLVEMLNRLAKQSLPDVSIVNIVDDSLVRYALTNGNDDCLRKRIKNYLHSAVDAGADIILSSCSSVGEAVEAAREAIQVPIVRIDEPMAEKAVILGERIGIYATAASTFGPTSRLLHSKAKAAGRTIDTSEQFCPGAFELLLENKVSEHDRLVTESLLASASQFDVLVFAQASMSRLAPSIAKQIDRPLLTSPELAFDRLARMFKTL